MKFLTLQQEGNVFVLTMNNHERANTFTDEVVKEFYEAFEKIEAFQGNTALILHSNSPKFWSNGIDLEWLQTKPRPYWQEFIHLLDEFLIKCSFLNVPTVACINGHCYGGGAILASTFDFRIMNSDKGWFCFPEIDVKIPFSHLMHQIVNHLSDSKTMREMLFLGKKISGKEAFEGKIVDYIYPSEELFTKTMEFAQVLASKDRRTYGHIKSGLKNHLVPFLKKV